MLKIINNVEWININDIILNDEPDVIISFSDMNLFKNLNVKKILMVIAFKT